MPGRACKAVVLSRAARFVTLMVEALAWHGAGRGAQGWRTVSVACVLEGKRLLGRHFMCRGEAPFNWTTIRNLPRCPLKRRGTRYRGCEVGHWANRICNPVHNRFAIQNTKEKSLLGSLRGFFHGRSCDNRIQVGALWRCTDRPSWSLNRWKRSNSLAT